MSAIAVTGCGVICAIGCGVASVFDALKDGRSGITYPRLISSIPDDLPVGEVNESDNCLKARLSIPETDIVSRTALLGAVAVKEAMLQSGLRQDVMRSKRVAFISGTTVGGMDITERYFEQMLSDERYARLLIHHHSGASTNAIARICGLDSCYCSTISTACSSALNAIIQGTRMLLAGEADIVVAGGAEALTRFHLLGFNSLKILDHEPCRPFDADRNGLNLGEGAGYVVLERWEDARQRGAASLAFVAGFGNRCDAYHQTATSENGEGAYLAMSDALRMSGLRPCDIDYVNAHGTGTPDNDRSESVALNRIFGDAIPPVSSTKSLTGHATSASGGIEAVICMLAMNHGFIPPNIGWEKADSDCIVPEAAPTGAPLHSVLCNSFGFGGNDSSIIFSDTPVRLPDTMAADAAVLGCEELQGEADLSSLGPYIGPMERRRMSTLMKAATLTSLKALEKAHVKIPDAIIIATRYGMLEQGEKILRQIAENSGDGLSPTLFMQSTHNTIAGSLAIMLGCHGWNMTYSHGASSFAHAMAEAHRLISEGRARTVLVGEYDFCPDGFMARLEAAGEPVTGRLKAKSIVIGKI